MYAACASHAAMTTFTSTWTVAPSRLRTAPSPLLQRQTQDRKSTRLNSSHANISYAVFCLKKKKETATRRGKGHHAAVDGRPDRDPRRLGRARAGAAGRGHLDARRADDVAHPAAAAPPLLL